MGEHMADAPLDDIDILIIGGPRTAIRFTQDDIISTMRSKADPTAIGGGRRLAQKGPDGEIGKRSFRLSTGLDRRLLR